MKQQTQGNPTEVARRKPATSAVAKRAKQRLGQRISRRHYLTIAILVFAGLIVVWWASTTFGLVNPLFLPTPQDVITAMGQQSINGELWGDIGASIYRIGVGYLLATAMSIPLGILMGSSARFEAALEPLMDFIRYMPVVAFVPLTILWVGTDDSQKFLIIWMGTFFQQVLLVSDAVRQVPNSLINLGETLGMSRAQILIRIVLPSSMPRVWDALRISLGWAWTWLVVAELVAASSGMGYRITVAQRYFATDVIIGYVLILGVLGLVFDQAMRALGRRFFSYQKGRL
jgi:NitT/TauT family transport system permease protein